MPFNLNVYVKDYANLTVESQNGPYLVNLNVSQGSFSGKVSVETINGIANFSDLQFEGAWTITLTATSEYMIAASVTLTITNFAHSILLTIPDYLPSANFSFEIQVHVLDLYNNGVINNEPVLVSGSKSFVEISKYTLSVGVYAFSVYLTEAGMQSVVFTTIGHNGVTVFNETTIDVQSLKLVITSFNHNVRVI